MKSAEAWIEELNIPRSPVGDIGVEGITAIQADATADLQSQVEQLTRDNTAYLVSINEAGKFNFEMGKMIVSLRAALEKCVVALEWIKSPTETTDLEAGTITNFFVQRDTMMDDAIATAKPLLNKS